MLSANEQRAAGADVDREVETLCKQVFDLKTRVETGVQASELAARVSAITQTVTKLHSANNELQRTFIGPREPGNHAERVGPTSGVSRPSGLLSR